MRIALPLACAAGVIAAVAIAAPARADPCKAISDSGRLPPGWTPRQAFSGTVRYVGDGDSLCVRLAPADPPALWVEVRLGDFNAPELHDPGGAAARDALVRVAMGRRVDCLGDHVSFDRLVATCRLASGKAAGVGLGDLMRAEGIVEGGR
ncbi:MAG: nuclease [Caulobacter sp.]|nr:nuclease [Caulobacter sp.]